ncbi:MAG TPA: chloride channel protein [Gammaproteobacteria bacterium]|nr:chloride channel protein [Gammaproteobacteria bacterium]
MWLLKLDRTPRLIILSIVLGIIGGFGAQLFLLLLHWGDVYILGFIGHYPTIHVAAAHAAGVAPEPFSHWYWWMPVSTTLGGLVVGFLIYGLAPETEGHGTDASLNAFHRNNGRMRARVPFVKTLASALTIGSGGSGGREGPTAQIASGAGAIFGQIFNLPDEERRTVVLIGMAAGLSAIFKSPLGTAIFAVEILYSRMAFEGGALIFTLISASVAYAVIGAFSGYTPLFLLPPSTRVIQPLDLVWFGLLGVLAGALGALMPAVYYRIRDWFAALKIPRYFKPAIGGLAVGLIGIAVPPVIGGGYGYMQFALQGGSGLAMGLLLLFSLGKIVTLSLTVGSGGSAGVFGPTLFIGTMLGASFAALLHLFHIHIDGSWLAVVGMAAVFAGTARVPIASMVMVIEMTSGFQLIMPTMLAVALAFIVQFTLTRHAKYPTIYEGQVSTPADSPVYRDLFYQTAAELLRRRQVRLDRDILTSELQVALDRGEGVPLRRRGEQLYSVNVVAGTPVAGREVRSLGLAEMGVLIVGLIRGESEIVPNGSTRLQVGDGLLVAATADSIGEFRALVAPPQAAGEETPADHAEQHSAA